MTADPAPTRRSLRRRVGRVVLWLVLGALALRAVTSIVGAVDWPAVRDAFVQVPGVSLVLLGIGLLVRQTLNAVPVAIYVPGLGTFRAVQNDLAAHVAGTALPPPGDLVLRVAMFRSWGVDPARGLAGVTLNSVTYYAVRFGTPVLGVIAVGFYGIDSHKWLLAAGGLTLGVVVIVGLVLILRGDRFAAWVGRASGRVVRTVRRSVDPDLWASAAVDLRARSAADLRRGLPRSCVALVTMVVLDATLLVVALRATGVDASALPLQDVAALFLLAYPITVLPMSGVGVLDAVLLGILVTDAGVEHEPGIVAALLVWRTVTLLGPFVLGLLVLATWRRRSPRRLDAADAPRPRESEDG